MAADGDSSNYLIRAMVSSCGRELHPIVAHTGDGPLCNHLGGGDPANQPYRRANR